MDPSNNLDDFADLSARLADPMSPRALVLAEAGVPDERALTVIHAEWKVRLKDAQLWQRFRTAFDAARAKLHVEKTLKTGEEPARAEPLPARSVTPPLEAAPEIAPELRAAAGDPLDATAAVMRRVLPETPFVAPPRDKDGKPVAPPVSRPSASEIEIEHEDSGTVALPAGSVSTKPVTPFEHHDLDDEQDDLDATVAIPPKEKP